MSGIVVVQLERVVLEVVAFGEQGTQLRVQVKLRSLLSIRGTCVDLLRFGVYGLSQMLELRCEPLNMHENAFVFVVTGEDRMS